MASRSRRVWRRRTPGSRAAHPWSDPRYPQTIPSLRPLPPSPEEVQQSLAYLDSASEQFRALPELNEPRGIITCGGGPKYFPCLFTNCRLLRKLGCELPIEVWHLGDVELTDEMKELLLEVPDLRLIDAREIQEEYPFRGLNGWELKSFALLHTGFNEVLFLDADNVPTRNPEVVFENEQYKKTGSLFWPDFGRTAEANPIWTVTGVPYRDEPEFEAGQFVVDRERQWEMINYAVAMNQFSDFYYRFIYGDKDTFRFAHHLAGSEYGMMPPCSAIMSNNGRVRFVIVQHDEDGLPLFQHRNGDKWKVGGHGNVDLSQQFQHEGVCREILTELKNRWSGHTPAVSEKRDEFLTSCNGRYRVSADGTEIGHLRVVSGGILAECPNGLGNAWDVADSERGLQLQLMAGRTPTARLSPCGPLEWRGLDFRGRTIHAEVADS